MVQHVALTAITNCWTSDTDWHRWLFQHVTVTEIAHCLACDADTLRCGSVCSTDSYHNSNCSTSDTDLTSLIVTASDTDWHHSFCQNLRLMRPPIVSACDSNWYRSLFSVWHWHITLCFSMLHWQLSIHVIVQHLTLTDVTNCSTSLHWPTSPIVSACCSDWYCSLFSVWHWHITLNLCSTDSYH